MGMSELEYRVWLCAALLGLAVLTLVVFFAGGDSSYKEVSLVGFACISLFLVERHS